MNIFKTIKILRRFQKFFSLLENAQKEQRMGKNILASKTFWFNILTGAASALEVLPIPYATEALALLNIALRLVTKKPVTILPQ